MRHSISVPSLVSAAALAALAATTCLVPAEAGGAKKKSPHGRDTTPPTLVLPADITVGAIAPMGRAVFWTATATDDTDSSPIIVSSRASGSAFRVGTTTVTVTAKDSAGNATTGSFRVTVLPMAGPVPFKEQWMDWDGSAWFEWDLVVSPDGTVSGSGRQLYLIDVYRSPLGGFPAITFEELPAGLEGSGVMSGTIAADGSCRLVSSHHHWYVNAYETDASGGAILSEDTGGATVSTTAWLFGDNIRFSASPLDAPDVAIGNGAGSYWSRP